MIVNNVLTGFHSCGKYDHKNPKMSDRILQIVSKRVKLDASDTAIIRLVVNRGIVFIYDNVIHVWDGEIEVETENGIRIESIKQGYFNRRSRQPLDMTEINARQDTICAYEDEDGDPVICSMSYCHEDLLLWTAVFKLMKDPNHPLWKDLTPPNI